MEGTKIVQRLIYIAQKVQMHPKEPISRLSSPTYPLFSHSSLFPRDNFLLPNAVIQKRALSECLVAGGAKQSTFSHQVISNFHLHRPPSCFGRWRASRRHQFLCWRVQDCSERLSLCILRVSRYCVLVGVACVCPCTVYFDIFIPVVFNSHPYLSLSVPLPTFILFLHTWANVCTPMMEDKLRRIERKESKTLSGRGIFMIAFTNDKDYCLYHCIYGNSYSSLIFWSRYHCVDCCLQFLSNGVRCKMPITPGIAKSTFHFNL